MIYFTNNKQKDQCRLYIQVFSKNILRVPRGWLIRLLLFIINICNLFIVNNDADFASYANDRTLWITGKSFGKIIPELEISLFSS